MDNFDAEKLKKEKKIEKKVKKFMAAVKQFLKSKGNGTVAPELECSLMLLETYYHQFLEITEEVNSLDSLLIMGRYGPAPTPLLTARDKASTQLVSLMKEMGLTFKAQAKLDVIEPQKEVSPLESFVKNKIEKR